jgi:Outer membrane protein beta-barrel domain
MVWPGRLVRGAATAFLLGPLFAGSAQAQRQFELTPFIGYLIPLGTLYQGGNLGAKISQTSGFAFGGNFAYNMSSRLGFEGGLTYGSGELDLDPGALPDEDDNLFMLSAVARYRVNALAYKNQIHVLGGLGILHHGGDAVGLLKDAGTKGFTHLGLILGGSYTLPIGRGLSVRFEGRDHIYSSKLEDDQGGESDSSLQNDVLLTAGISLPLGEPIQRR